MATTLAWAIGLAGAILASIWLAKANPGQQIPQAGNARLGASLALYAASAIIAVGGFLVFGGNLVLFLLFGLVVLPLPLQVARRMHNAGLPGRLP